MEIRAYYYDYRKTQREKEMKRKLKKIKKRYLFPLDKYILAALKRIWKWYPARKEALLNALVEVGGVEKYVCAKCLESFVRKWVRVDHILPVVDPVKGFEGWDVYIKRLFCHISNLQILCCACHNKKTIEENKIRRQHEKS